MDDGNSLSSGDPSPPVIYLPNKKKKANTPIGLPIPYPITLVFVGSQVDPLVNFHCALTEVLRPRRAISQGARGSGRGSVVLRRPVLHLSPVVNA